VRTKDGYRFTLQFSCKSEYQRQMGEFLEWLGSKKSRLILAALSEYLSNHPESLRPGDKIHLDASGFTKNDIMDMIREALVEKGTNIPLPDESPPAEFSDANVAAMFENLNLFEQIE